MSAPLDFYFDFSSPYGYFASLAIEDLAARHGRGVAWRPILLGVVFKTTGQSPLLDQPLRGAYARRDLERTARELGIRYQVPESFPINGIAASRAFYWLDERDPGAAEALVHAVFGAIFAEGRDMSPAAEVVALAKAKGLAGDELAAALEEPAVKVRLKAEVDAAMSRGIFGSPTVVVDGEAFWGFDQFPRIERWLQRGGL